MMPVLIQCVSIQKARSYISCIWLYFLLLIYVDMDFALINLHAAEAAKQGVVFRRPSLCICVCVRMCVN